MRARDKRKNDFVAGMGLEMVRVDAEDVRNDPERTLAVILERWQAFTGKRATLEATGEPFPGHAGKVRAA